MRRAIFAVIVFLMSAPFVFGQGATFIWTGATGNGNWFDKNNWTPRGLPTYNDKVIIPNNTPPCVLSNKNAYMGNINIAQGAVFIANNATIFTNEIQNWGKIEIQNEVTIERYPKSDLQIFNNATGLIEGQNLKVLGVMPNSFAAVAGSGDLQNAGNIVVDKFQFHGAEVNLLGNSLIRANEISFDARNGFSSYGGKVEANTGTSGTGGSIDIKAGPHIILQNGAKIEAGNSSTGSGGNVNIEATSVDIRDNASVIRAGNSSIGTGGNVNIHCWDIMNKGKIIAGQGVFGNGKIDIQAKNQFSNKGHIGTTSGTLGKIARPQQHTLCNVTITSDNVLIAPEAGGMIIADTLIVFGRMVNVAIKSGVGIGLRSGVEFRTTVDGILDFTETTYWQPIGGGFFKRIFSNRVIPSEQWRLQGIFGGPVSVFPADTNLLDALATIADVTGLAGTTDTLRLRLQNLSTTAQSLRYSVSSRLGWVSALQAGTDKIAPFAVDSTDILYTIPAGTARGTVDTVIVVVSIGSSFADTTYGTITCLSRSTEPWALARIAVEPAEANLSIGQQQQFTAVGMNADDDTLYFEPVWSADGGAIDSTGLFTATQTGNFVVTCTDPSSGVFGRSVVHVGTGITTIVVEPAEANLSIGQQQQFTAVGMNADHDKIYFEPVWSSDGGAIDSTGLYTATQSGNFVVTCTDPSSGVFGRAVVHVGATGEKTDRILLPQAFALRQNYPNPFNPVTTIEYHVKENCEVILTLYDVSGKQTAILAKGAHQAGIYKVRFDAGELPAGIYFYRIRMQDYEAVRKMVLVR